LIYPLLRSLRNLGTSRVISFAIVLLLLGGLAICYTLPMFHLPKTTGSYPVAIQTLHFIDPVRVESHAGAPHKPREVTIDIWYPSASRTGKHGIYRLLAECDLRSTYQSVLKTDSLQDAPIAQGKFPIILFNHAWRGFRQRSTYIMQELASQGFVVVAISHPYNAAKVLMADGSVADGRNQPDLGSFYNKPILTLDQRLAMWNEELTIQTADDKLVLDDLTQINDSSTNTLAGHLDLTHVGAFGHSFGGNVSAQLAHDDPRVLSAIVLDGVLHGPVGSTGLPKPLFRIQAESPEAKPGDENSPIQSTRVHAQMSNLGEGNLARSFHKFGGYQVVLRGIDHENFTDKGFFSPFHSLTGIGSIPMPRAAFLIDSYIVAFFTQTLKGKPQPLLTDTKPPFPEVVRFQSWPAETPSTSATQ
jgi:dienelactone hydrolase